MKEAALAHGALGCGISGSGPSLFAFASSREAAAEIAAAMENALKETGVPCTTLVSRVGGNGARIVS
jgi:homoserine kinase